MWTCSQPSKIYSFMYIFSILSNKSFKNNLIRIIVLNLMLFNAKFQIHICSFLRCHVFCWLVCLQNKDILEFLGGCSQFHWKLPAKWSMWCTYICPCLFAQIYTLIGQSYLSEWFNFEKKANLIFGHNNLIYIKIGPC